MKPCLSLEDFFLFVLQTDWISQSEFASSVFSNPGTVSRNKMSVAKGGTFTRSLANNVLSGAALLAHRLVTARDSEALSSSLELLSEEFDLSPKQMKAISGAHDASTVEEEESCVTSLITSLQSRRIPRTIPAVWDEPTAITDESNDVYQLMKDFDMTLTGARGRTHRAVILEDNREETIAMTSDDTISRFIVRTVHLAKNASPYTHRIGMCTDKGQMGVDAVSNVNVAFNGLPAEHYYKGSNVTYSLGSCPSCHIEVPILADDKDIVIVVSYTLNCVCPSDIIAADSICFDTPCRQIEHSFILQAEARQYLQMSASVFFPLQKARNNVPVFISRDSTSIIVHYSGWDIPGSGYSFLLSRRTGS